MHPAFNQTDHRPWPLPKGPWVMSMKWHDLLFAHWPVPVETLRAHVPGQLEIDTFDGSAWLSITPFRMSGVRPRFVPDELGLRLPELNVRTYVSGGGYSGVWFFSLDAASRLAVRMARLFYHLPYFDADMRCEPNGAVEFRSRRTHRDAADAELVARYRPTDDVFEAQPGTLEHFLAERYALFGRPTAGKVLMAEIHHPQWPLQPAEAEIEVNTMADSFGLSLDGPPAILHYSRHLDVVAWYPRLL